MKGRKLDDNVHVMMRYKGGAKGMLWASQVAPGNENNLKLRVYGTKGGLEWWQEHPNQLIWSPLNKPPQILSRGTGAANAAAARVTRVPPGHPEGYLEGFANIYTEVAAAIRAGAVEEEARSGGHVPDGGGRRARHRLHRGGGEVLGQGWEVGEGVAP